MCSGVQVFGCEAEQLAPLFGGGVPQLRDSVVRGLRNVPICKALGTRWNTRANWAYLLHSCPDNHRGNHRGMHPEDKHYMKSRRPNKLAENLLGH